MRPPVGVPAKYGVPSTAGDEEEAQGWVRLSLPLKKTT